MILAGDAHVVHHEPMESPPSAPVSGRFTAAAAGAAVVVALAGSAVAAAYDRAGGAVFAGTLSVALAIAAAAVVGAVITLAVPGNRVGWLLLAAAAVMGAGAALTQAGIHGVVTAPVLPSLLTCEISAGLRVARVADQSRDFLQLVERRGLKPGSGVRVEHRDEAADTVDLRLESGEALSLGNRAASKIFVEPA